MKKFIVLITTCVCIVNVQAWQQRLSSLWNSQTTQAARVSLHSVGRAIRMDFAQSIPTVSWWQQLKTKIESPFREYFAQRLESQVKLELPKQQAMLDSSPSIRYFKDAQQQYVKALKGQNSIEIERAARNLDWTIGLARRSIYSTQEANAKYARGRYSYIRFAFERAVEPVKQELTSVSAELKSKMNGFVQAGQRAEKTMFKDSVQRDIDLLMNVVARSKPRSFDDAQRLLFEEHTHNEFVRGARDVLVRFKSNAVQNAEQKPLEEWTQFEAEVWKQKIDQALKKLEGREL